MAWTFRASRALRAIEEWTDHQQPANHVLSSSLRVKAVGRSAPEAIASTCIRSVDWNTLEMTFKARKCFVCVIGAT